MKTCLLALLLALETLHVSAAPPQAAPIGIRTLSTRADRISGGDVLVEVTAPAAPVVTVNGRDVSAAFHAMQGSRGYVGLVTNLSIGKNVLKVAGKPSGSRDAQLELTNYAITGPI